MYVIYMFLYMYGWTDPTFINKITLLRLKMKDENII